MKRFTLRISDELYEMLKTEKFKTGISINEIIIKLIENKYQNIVIDEKGDMKSKQINELSKEGLKLQSKIIKEKNYQEFSIYSAKISTSIKRLMDSLNKNNQELFMNEVINLYSIVGEPVPKVIVETLSELDWTTKMYAFLVGLHGE